MTKEQLFAEVEDVLRTMPSMATILDRNQDNFSWFGRAAAVIDQWDFMKGVTFRGDLDALRRATTLVISFAIFHPCGVFNPMKMPRQSQLR
jgi:hypothetical protein